MVYVTDENGEATPVANLQGVGYQKPVTGIPLSDLASPVQAAINGASTLIATGFGANTEALTGEMFLGYPVYVQVFTGNIAALNAGDTASVTLIPTAVRMIGDQGGEVYNGVQSYGIGYSPVVNSYVTNTAAGLQFRVNAVTAFAGGTYAVWVKYTK